MLDQVIWSVYFLSSSWTEMSQANRHDENDYTAVFQAFLEDHHREDIASVPLNGISRITKNFKILLPSPWSSATRQRNFDIGIYSSVTVI